MQFNWYVISGLNPIPWKVGPIGSMRRGGKLVPYVAPDPELKSYQDGLRTWFITNGIPPLDPPYQIRFLFWRKIISYQGKSRMVTKQRADQTNLQKATEDALQPSKSPEWAGLISNDRECQYSGGLIVEQEKDTEPMVAIEIFSGIPTRDVMYFPRNIMPETAMAVLDARRNTLKAPADSIDNSM